jgi:hypothetical protein
MRSAEQLLRFRDLVRMFCVSFHLRPTYVSLASHGPEVGFELQLIGTHQKMKKHDQSRCARCGSLLLLLLELADECLPEEQQSVQSSTRCEKVIHYTSSAGDWPEVVLRISVIRRASVENAAANRFVQLDQLLQLTEEIKTELSNLGCRQDLFDGVTELLPTHDRGACARSVA